MIEPDVRSVWVSKLKLTHFRNYASLDLALDQRHVVLTGDNGAGKTNLLEAVSFLSPGRGLRRAPYDRVAQQQAGDDADPQAGTWTVFAALETENGTVNLGTGLAMGPDGVENQRKLHINGVAAKRADDLLDYTRVVWLTPAMDGLFSGPASDRRRFLDRMVLAIDPAHGRRVNDYERAMRGRNKLLEQPRPDGAWLDGLEAQLAETGVAIALARRELIGLLRQIISETDIHADAVFPHADLAIEGLLEDMVSDGSAVDLEDNFRAELCRNRPRDRAAGRTLDGPHRSNLAVRHGPKDMEAALCSTGEQKALLLGLVLAHAQLVRTVADMPPLVLLDEVAAHLDADRRAGLFSLIESIGCQAWMTGTDVAMFEALRDRAQFFTVASGTVLQAQ